MLSIEVVKDTTYRPAIALPPDAAKPQLCSVSLVSPELELGKEVRN